MGDNDLAVGYAMGQSESNNRCNNGGWGDGCGWWIWIIVLFAMFGWGGNGFGWGNGVNNGGAVPYLSGVATRSDISEGFALNNIQNGITAIQQGICDSTYALNNTINSGFNATNVALLQGFNGVDRQMCNIGFQLQDCCCQTQRAIDGVNYNMATNTCALQNTMNNNTRDIIDSQNAGTRAILDYLCQDKIYTLQNEVQALRLAASQSNQNAAIGAMIDASTAEILRRSGRDCPIPAYVVPNPNCCYGNPTGVNYGGYNNGGCGCNSGCNTCGC